MFNDETLTAATKADFGRIYGEPDPRAYFRALHPLGYQVPQRALPVFRSMLAAPGRSPRARTVLDVCCSYGINGALLGHAVDLDELGRRYTDPALAGLRPDELAADDRRFYARRGSTGGVTVHGVDASAPAVNYALAAGLLSRGWAEDLESHPPSPGLAAGARAVGTVVCTGGVGYIGERTFSRLLDTFEAPEQVWLAVFVLRVFDYAPIAEVFEPYGLVTERLPGTFPQRRFADADEAGAAVDDVRARGLDPTGRESDGWFHADCFLTRPRAAAAALPVAALLSH
jgi:hypothetical protein